MDLAQFPRRRYTQGSTAIEEMPNLSQLLNGPQIYIKRDDMLGLTLGGNKTRKLEFLVADALLQGADTLITCGAVQSNHCRLTLAAAAKEGLNCRLVLEERVPNSYSPDAGGNNFLFHLLGVEKITVVPGGTDMNAAMLDAADEAKASGGVPYIIPGGGSNEIGATGYAACAEEIMLQTFESGRPFQYVVCASGSGGTHSGLVAGLCGNHSEITVLGINISRPKEEQEQIVHGLAQRTLNYIGVPHSIPKDKVICFDDYIGKGYSLPSEDMIHAVNLAARTEGIIVDPVYTGKVMAGLIGLVEQGYFKPDDRVLFVHTGGSPALFAYQHYFM